MTNPKIILNGKFSPLFENDTRFYIVTGGRGSAKSFGVGAFSTLLSYENGHKILFTRQTMTSAHLSIIPEFQEKIDLFGVNDDFSINKGFIENIQSKSEIIFKGLKTSSGDQTANLKSLQGISTWILDEAEELTDEATFDKINLSLRTKGVQNRVILILNPTTKEHWIYKRFFQEAGISAGFNGVKGDVTYIHTTYKDNEKHLDESFINEVNRIKKTNPAKYSHVVMGGWLDKAEGVVFTNWKYGKFNPDNFQTSFGQDYGFSVDPTTLIEVAVDKKKKIIYAKEHLYKARLTTSQIAHINKEVCKNKLIVGDSAEPRLIQELAGMGCNIVGAEKGAGSISLGIALIQDYQLIVDGVNLGKELNNYVYADKGSKLFVDDFNHLIDPLRYNITYNLGRSNGIDIW